MVKSVIKFFCSLRLTVVLLTLAMFLVFFGTMAQVDLGLYESQARFFRSFVVYWTPPGTDWTVPVFPGGYLLGALLLANLIAAHLQRFTLTWKKAGIFMIHAGIILLLTGQLATDMMQVESGIRFREGQTRNYSEADRSDELVVINKASPEYDEILAIPAARLNSNREFSDSRIPFTISVKSFYENSGPPQMGTGSPASTQGIGSRYAVAPAPRVTDTEHRNIPSVVVELKNAGSTIGSWLVTDWIEETQDIQFGANHFKLLMRPIRYYKPFSLQLLKFRHDRYVGTDIPNNFSSNVRILNPATKEDREVRISMNNPLRYGGETFYQASFDKDPKVTILQVVHNPGWLVPYIACILVGGGMLYQFLFHLTRFISKTKAGMSPAMAKAQAVPARKRSS
jgi:hypothetical protein